MQTPVSADQALAQVRSGDRVYIHGGCATPTPLLAALARRAASLEDVETVALHMEGPAPHVDASLAGHLRHNALFIGPNVREAVNAGRADFTPVFLSDIPALFSQGPLPLDVALIHVSPPDAHGFCSLGVSVDVAQPAAEAARHVIAEINAQMPRSLGDAFIHQSRFDAYIETDRPVLEYAPPRLTAVHEQIGREVATLIEDGATLQMGIGAVPDAILQQLGGHKDLGIHTEMFSDGVIDLVESGVITGARKPIFTGMIVSSFVMGTRRLYDFIDDNPMVSMHPSHETNDIRAIAKHGAMVAVNSAIQVDLSGQVCADSIGSRFYSGIGGQLDFIRGAAASPQGRPIIALPSTAEGGSISRIVAELTPGAGVVTTRGDVYFVVTEHGIAALHGRSVRDRAQALLNVAAPSFREELARRAHALYGFSLQV
ncbi:MAG: acetyl-CoA hydrolase [Chloroflexi bacterium]|nr:MAG: acetyl-CoA hydrolase [Chloroflexota bacterium]